MLRCLGPPQMVLPCFIIGFLPWSLLQLIERRPHRTSSPSSALRISGRGARWETEACLLIGLDCDAGFKGRPAVLVVLRGPVDDELAADRVDHDRAQLARPLHGLREVGQRLLVEAQRSPLQQHARSWSSLSLRAGRRLMLLASLTDFSSLCMCALLPPEEISGSKKVTHCRATNHLADCPSKTLQSCRLPCQKD